jgi:ribulose 1,5-bisphosphate carboxylase large subunit-like protein
VIKVDVTAHLSKNGRPPNGNAIEASIRQCVADAVEGSFDEYPPHLKGMLRVRARLLNDSVINAGDHVEVRFSIGLPDQLFPVASGGLQLLVNLLAGDFFPSEVSGCRWSEATVQNVELPDELMAVAVKTFRQASAHDIEAIRSAFGLPANRPLLAFSLKPRVGPTFDEIRRITLDVLAEGFNIVELDARNLALSTAPLERWIELGVEAAQVGTHVTAFSPNVTIPAPQLLNAANAWVEGVAGHGPPVLKVDGGLDGITNLQSLRTALVGDRAPIVTSYPVLRNQLSSALGGPDAWTDLLALSGADIVYPGGRPTFPNERRPVWGVHAEDWSRAARIYDSMIMRGWPMPTIAGGIHPGHLHACYELVGPKVAYFLGGAVALHPNTIRDGARLCVDVLEEAIRLADDAVEAGNDHAADLSHRLLKRVETTKYPKTKLNYFSPANIFGLSQEASPQTFYRRNN